MPNDSVTQNKIKALQVMMKRNLKTQNHPVVRKKKQRINLWQ